MFLITAVVKTTGLTLQYYIDGTEGEPFDAEIELTDEEFGQLVQLIIEYKEQEFYTEDEHIEGGIFTEEFLCDKAPELHEKLADFAYGRIDEELLNCGFEEDEIMDAVKQFEVSNDFISDVLNSVS